VVKKELIGDGAKIAGNLKLRQQLAEWYDIDLEGVDRRIEKEIFPKFIKNIKNKIIVMD